MKGYAIRSFISYMYRVYCWYFNPKKVVDSLERRRGRCIQCGRCCTTFGRRCMFLTKDNKCRIYKHRPFFGCVLPPLDLTDDDVKHLKELRCTYWFKDKRRGEV